MKKIFKKRKKARKLILQCLYGTEISKNNISNIEKFIINKNNKKKLDFQYLQQLLIEIINRKDLIDKTIKQYTKINLKSLNLIELIIIRIATFELIYCEKIPYKVIINEALILSKNFSEKLGYTFINKILDKLAKNIRKTKE